MSTLSINPEFNSGALDQHVQFLLDEKYPVDVRNGVPYVTGQYIARFRYSKQSEGIPPKWATGLLKGEKLEVKKIWRLTPGQKPELKPGGFVLQLLQLCRCCETPLFLLNISPIGTDTSIVELLQESAFISPGGDGTPQGTALFISPGGDGTPQGTSLDILAQNQYTFSSDTPVDGMPDGPTSKPVSPRVEKTVQPVNLTPAELTRTYGPTFSSTQKAVRIAIIDTGFNRELMEGTITNQVTIWNKIDSSPCNLTNDRVGWNFIGTPTLKELFNSRAYGVDASGTRIENKLENNNPKDDSLNEHGTLLAALITKYAQSTPTALMILKAFDKDGKGTLFAVICALCYAQANKADVVNASFIAHNSPGIAYLTSVIEDLRRKGIIVVCAAGNRGSGSDSRGQLLTGQLFPACYSQRYKNVITTTSIWGNSQHRRLGVRDTSSENYSPEFVNVGVLTNHSVRADEGYFKAPYLWFRDLITNEDYSNVLARYSDAGVDGVVGSSFSTAIITGLVAGIIGHHGGITNLVGPGPDFSGTDPRAAIVSRLRLVASDGIGLVINNLYVQA